MVDEEKDGGAAFPHPVPRDHWGQEATGMSLRDYFAGCALKAIMTERSIPDAIATSGAFIERAACMSYLLADAMLRERNRD